MLPVAALLSPLLVATSALPVAKPLPNLQSVIALVREHQAETERLEDSYAYGVKNRVHLLNGKGEELRVIRETEAVHVAHKGRVLAQRTKINGQAPDAEAIKDDETWNARHLNRPSVGEQRNWGFPEAIHYLEACKISILRREQVCGRSVLVVAFQAGPPGPGSNPMAAWASAMSGSLFLDEETGQMTQMDAVMVRDLQVQVNPKLVSTRGTVFSSQRQWINDEIWLPARFSLASPSGQGYLENLSLCEDYRRFELGAIQIERLPETTAPLPPQPPNPSANSAAPIASGSPENGIPGKN